MAPHQIKGRSEHILGKGEIRQAYKRISTIGTWRRKMEQKSFEGTKPKTKNIRFSSNAPKIERVFLAGDFNGCMLVVPEVLGTPEQIILCEGRFHTLSLGRGREER